MWQQHLSSHPCLWTDSRSKVISEPWFWLFWMLFLSAQVSVPALLWRWPSPAGGLGLQHGSPSAAHHPQELPAGRSNTGQDSRRIRSDTTDNNWDSYGHICTAHVHTQSHTNIANTNSVQVQSLFRSGLWTLNSFPVKDVVVLRCDCISFFARAKFLLALLFCGQSRQTWLSWKEHLFLSFFPLWGNQYNLQTQMYGRRVEPWAILLERQRNV